MLNLQLPRLEADASPSFTDAGACARWISQFQLTDIRRAQQTLADELDELNRYSMPAIERLKITEMLRDSVNLVQAEAAKRIIGKALPLSDSELQSLRALVGLWTRMRTSYGWVLAACIAGEEVSRQHALVCQRCLRHVSDQILEYLRVGYQADPALWRSLHELFRHAEEAGFAALPVPESLAGSVPPSSCADHYVRTLLLCQANPYERERKEWRMLIRWLDEWSSWVKVRKDYPANAVEVPPLEVSADRPAAPVRSRMKSTDPAVRYLDVTELNKNLRVKIVLLQQGRSPQEIGLGPECVEPDCRYFLEDLLKFWCEGRDSREFERRSVNHRASLCFGIEALHYQLTGKPFRQPRPDSTLSTREKNEIFTFGRIVGENKVAEPVYSEEWNIQDESRFGFRLLRKAGAGEERFFRDHLLGVKDEGSEKYVPAVIRWIIVGQSGDVNAGVRLFPGLPEAVAMRATGINLTVSTKYVQAIILRQQEDSLMQDSVIVPPGWFSPGRVVEAIGSDVVLLKFEALLSKGANYEQVRFSMI